MVRQKKLVGAILLLIGAGLIGTGIYHFLRDEQEIKHYYSLTAALPHAKIIRLKSLGPNHFTGYSIIVLVPSQNSEAFDANWENQVAARRSSGELQLDKAENARLFSDLRQSALRSKPGQPMGKADMLISVEPDDDTPGAEAIRRRIDWWHGTEPPHDYAYCTTTGELSDSGERSGKQEVILVSEPFRKWVISLTTPPDKSPKPSRRTGGIRLSRRP